MVERVLGNLKVSNRAEAVALLALADMVRGYGPVKEEAVETYRRKLDAAEAGFLDAGEDRRVAA